MSYDVGDVVRVGNYSGASLSEPFENIVGAATDPTAVSLTVERPDATVLVYGWPLAGDDGTLTKESTGRFYFDVGLDQPGMWRYRLVGTGTAAAAARGQFIVRSKWAG